MRESQVSMVRRSTTAGEHEGSVTATSTAHPEWARKPRAQSMRPIVLLKTKEWSALEDDLELPTSLQLKRAAKDGAPTFPLPCDSPVLYSA